MRRQCNRKSVHERWKGLDFVVGIEVKLSNNHTLNGVPFTDICDELKGKYPKSFKFVGWHPQCRCSALSILMTEEEILDNLVNGVKTSENTVGNPPEGFSEWVEDNKEKIETARYVPGFIQDNFKGGDINKPEWIPDSGELLQSYIAKVKRQNEKVPFGEYEGKFVTETKQTAIEKLIELNKNADYEESYTFLANGEVYHKSHVPNSKTNIHFTDEERGMMKNAELYHNHPTGGLEIETLSKEDIGFMISNKLKSINAIYENKVYTIARKRDTIYETEFNQIYKDALNNAQKKAHETLNSKEFAIYRNGKIYNDVNKEIAKKFNLKYQSTVYNQK